MWNNSIIFQQLLAFIPNRSMFFVEYQLTSSPMFSFFARSMFFVKKPLEEGNIEASKKIWQARWWFHEDFKIKNRTLRRQ